MTHKLIQAALDNTRLIDEEQQHAWILQYGLSDKDLSKSLQSLKSILRSVLMSHSCEKAFKVQFKEMKGVLGSTDAKNINLNIDIFTKVPKDTVVSVFSAVALHEYFHVLYTDFGSKYLKMPMNSPYQMLWQLVEDTRIEVVGKDVNFSCEESFSLLMRNICYKSMKTLDIKNEDAELNKAVKVCCKWVRIPHLLNDEDRAFEVGGVNLCEELERIVPNYAPLDKEFSTDKVVDAIKEFIDKLQDKSQESGNEGEQNENIDEQGNSGSSQGNSGTEEDDKVHQDEKCTEGSKDDNEVDEPATEEPDEKPLKFDQKQFDKTIEEFKKALKGTDNKETKKLLEAILELDQHPIDPSNISHKGAIYISPNELPGSCYAPETINCEKCQPPNKVQLDVFRSDYNAVKHGVQAIRTRFLIRHSEMKSDIKEQNEGHIDRSRLYRAAYDDHIFKKTEITKSIGMDVCVLLDSSGSMQISNRITQCRRCGILLGEAFKGISGLNLSIYCHTTGNSEDWKGTCEITSLYGDLASKDTKNLSTFRPLGGTYDGFAIDFVGRRMLSKDSNNEKWLIVCCDGEPCASGYSGEGGIEHTGKVVRRLSKRGIHIIGVDIGNLPDFKRMFPVSTKFTDTRSLVTNMGKLVSSLVRRRSVEVHV